MAAAGFGTHASRFPLSTKHAGSLSTRKGSCETAKYQARTAWILPIQAQSWKIRCAESAPPDAAYTAAPAFYRYLLEFTRSGSRCVVNSIANAGSVTIWRSIE
jgi:hypothetical protein